MSATVSETKSLDFGGLTITYDARVLEPRPWTEAQALWAAELIRTAPPGPVLEVCAGAGHIGLLAVARSSRSLVSVDANPAACELTRLNAANAGLRVDVREGRMEDVLGPDERFAVIIADPPWVPSDEVSRYPEDPVSAIDGGAEGIDLIRSCLEVIRGHLKVGGSALLQVGPGQAEVVDLLLSADDDLRIIAARDFERGSLVLIDRLDWGVAP